MKRLYQGRLLRTLLVAAMAALSAASHAQPLSKNAAPFEKVEFNGGGVGVIVQLDKRRIVLSGLDFKNCMELVDTRAPDLPFYFPTAWQPDVSIDWSGVCVDGFRSGAGTLTYVNYPRGTVHAMTGSYKDGQRIGDWTSSSMGDLKFAPGQAIPAEILDAAAYLSRTLRLPSNLASRLGEHKNVVRSKQPGDLASPGAPAVSQLNQQASTIPAHPLANAPAGHGSQRPGQAVACPTQITVQQDTYQEFYSIRGSGKNAPVRKRHYQPGQPDFELGTVASQLPELERNWGICQSEGWPNLSKSVPSLGGGFSFVNCNQVRAGEPFYRAIQCHAGHGSEGNSTAESSDHTDTITPQEAGCPRYLRKSLVLWSRKPDSNPQLNVWQVRNVSNRVLKVTYRVNGANNDPGTLNPGDSAEVWQLREEPPYVVRDFNELVSFNRNQPQQKSLQCDLAIRPR